MARKMAIAELMRIPAADHDLVWLKESLQAAVTLEFATLPPYLSAFWSVKNIGDPVARSIRTVVREEMLHMALMCNLLAAIGAIPRLNAKDTLPRYPGPLPGGVNPKLEVALEGLSGTSVKVFMDVELPEDGPVALARGEIYPTIGAFYTAIQEAFDTLVPALSPDCQLEGPLGLNKLRTPAEVQQAIHLIKQQGEGSASSPEDTGPGDLAHYYRFGEIYHQKRLQKNESTGKWEFTGQDMPLPECWPMARVPLDGYQQSEVEAGVWKAVIEFDQAFSIMLGQLQLAWETTSQDALLSAIEGMLDMRTLAVALMQMPIPSRPGNYGPCFRLI